MQVKFPGVRFLETAPKFRKPDKKNSSSCVYVFHITTHWEILRPSCAVTAKKCSKKWLLRSLSQLFVCLFFFLVAFSLPSPSSLLKLPKNRELKQRQRRQQRERHKTIGLMRKNNHDRRDSLLSKRRSVI